MVGLEFARNAKEIRIITESVSLKDAAAKAEALKQKAFGTFSGLIKALKKDKSAIELVGHIKTYKPFWHLKGYSEFEYKRNSEYAFEVKPEVRSVKINSKTYSVADESPEVHFEGEDHCFETYEYEVITSGLELKEKNLQTYLANKSKAVKKLPKQKDVTFVPAKTRASFLVNNFLKDVVRPIHADKVLTEKAVIENLTLYYRPVWLFEFEDGNGMKRHLEVDAVTGAAAKVEGISLRKMIFQEQNIFDLTAEIAGNILPGAGIALVAGKAIKEKHAKKKSLKQMQKSRQAFQRKKR